MSNPPANVTRTVDQRDDHRCARCGASLSQLSGSRHHRMRRQVAGHSNEVLILLCGSGTTGCHGWVHANPAHARREGYTIPTSVKLAHIADVPVLIRWDLIDPYKKVYVLHRADGARDHIPEGLALELLFNFGMLQEVPA